MPRGVSVTWQLLCCEARIIRRHGGMLRAHFEVHMPNRREFVRGIAAAAAASWMTGAGNLAAAAPQAAGAPRRRQITIGGRRVRTIDIHAHITIPEAAAVLRGTPLERAGGAG